MVNPFVFHFLGFRVAGRGLWVVALHSLFIVHCTYVRTYVHQKRAITEPQSQANSGLLCSPTRSRSPSLPETPPLYYRGWHAVHWVEVV